MVVCCSWAWPLEGVRRFLKVQRPVMHVSCCQHYHHHHHNDVNILDFLSYLLSYHDLLLVQPVARIAGSLGHVAADACTDVLDVRSLRPHLLFVVGFIPDSGRQAK